jgi:hypothetical protein
MSDGDLISLAAMLKQRERDGVLAFDAKREIAAAWRGGRLTLTAEMHECRAQGLLKPGEPVPQIEHGRVRVPVVGGYKLFDWEKSYAWRRDDAKNRFNYRNISAPQREFEALWPPKDRGGRPSKKKISRSTAARLIEEGWTGSAAIIAEVAARTGARSATVKNHLRGMDSPKKRVPKPVSAP